MKLIVGIGNPGPLYTYTRHNAGFLMIDTFVQKHNLGNRKYESKRNAECLQSIYMDKPVFLCKPLTYMNLSGSSVVAIAKFYKILPADILVLHDEIDIPTATIKYKFGGSVAGHNGLKDIQAKLGTTDFARIRIGVDRPTHESVSDHVLGKLSPSEWEKIEEEYPVIEQMIRDFTTTK